MVAWRLGESNSRPGIPTNSAEGCENSGGGVGNYDLNDGENQPNKQSGGDQPYDDELHRRPTLSRAPGYACPVRRIQ